MGDKVGLPSAKGSSTSGHIQKSWAQKNNDKNLLNYNARHNSKIAQKGDDKRGSLHKENALIEHDKKRELQLRISELQDQLDDISSDESSSEESSMDHLQDKASIDKPTTRGEEAKSKEKMAKKSQKQELLDQINHLKRQMNSGKSYQPRSQRLAQGK